MLALLFTIGVNVMENRCSKSMHYPEKHSPLNAREIGHLQAAMQRTTNVLDTHTQITSTNSLLLTERYAPKQKWDSTKSKSL